MTKNRPARLNSLLQEVLAEVICRDVRDHRLSQFVSVTRVDISKDLRHAKVFVSVIGPDKVKEDSVDALTSAAGFIAGSANKKVTMRHFPQLTFMLDDSVDKHMRIHEALQKIESERQQRALNTEFSVIVESP